MAGYPFDLVDVFAEKPMTGNQLAVIRQAAGLSDTSMLAITREMNYSESTFILHDTPRDGGYDVRIYTMSGEVPFAGHPTLGTAYVIRQHLAPGRPDSVVLNLRVGPITVTFADDHTAWMRQRAPLFGAARANHAEVAAALGLSPHDIDRRYPVQAVSTGLPFPVVALKTRHALESVKPNWAAFCAAVPVDVEPEAYINSVLLFAPEPRHPENDLHVRVLFDDPYMPEDPATGSANGCLAGYLARNRYFGNERVDCRVEQGYLLNRPSLLLLRAHDTGDSVAVDVGGQVWPVAQGELLRG